MAGIIGLIAAMPQESRALLRRLTGVTRGYLDQLPIDTFSVSSQSCVLVTSGMGVRRASQATRGLVDKYDPILLISFGIGGAVEGDLDIGDVVLVEAFGPLEQGSPVKLTGLAIWPGLAREAAQQALASRGRHLFSGTAVTTAASHPAVGQLTGLAHPVLEMETVGIAHVAAQKGIPLLSLRAISDGPHAPIPLDLSTVMDEDANLKLSGLVNALVHNPLILLQSRRMLRNITFATESAAMALIATLNHWND
ncbi:MAG TPA: hypothetical protein VLD65_08625 [Anaerolineales bacterium]|nr:hypothetical protein [Anaerolineales bacterium]